MKVLIVEHEVRLGQFLRQGLSGHGYTTTWVKTCSEANDAWPKGTTTPSC
jgi:DNA-binding response OmpR family regulator